MYATAVPGFSFRSWRRMPDGTLRDMHLLTSSDGPTAQGRVTGEECEAMQESRSRSADILVIGPTGGTGSLVVRALWRRGGLVRVVARSEDEGVRLFGRSVEIVATRDQKLFVPPPEALAGIRKLLLISRPVDGWVDEAVAVIDSAAEAGVQHVVRLSAYRCHDRSRGLGATLHGERHRWIESYVEDLGLTYTHLRAALTYQALEAIAADGIRAQSVLRTPFGEGRVNLVDARDIAEVGARVLMEEGHERKVYELAGPEDLSMPTIAGRMTQRLGFTVRTEDVPPRAVRAWLSDRGLAEGETESLATLFEEGRLGYLTGRLSDLPSLLASAPITFDQYLSDEGYVYQPERPVVRPLQLALDLAA